MDFTKRLNLGDEFTSHGSRQGFLVLKQQANVLLQKRDDNFECYTCYGQFVRTAIYG